MEDSDQSLLWIETCFPGGKVGGIEEMRRGRARGGVPGPRAGE